MRLDWLRGAFDMRLKHEFAQGANGLSVPSPGFLWDLELSDWRGFRGAFELGSIARNANGLKLKDWKIETGYLTRSTL